MINLKGAKTSTKKVLLKYFTLASVEFREVNKKSRKFSALRNCWQIEISLNSLAF